MRKQLENLNVANIEIERIERVLNNVELNEEIIKELYSDTSIRRHMKNNGLWNSGNAENFAARYIGAGNIEVTNVKVWANYGKIRVYYTLLIDTIELKRFVEVQEVEEEEIVEEVEEIVEENNFDELIEDLKESVENKLKKEEQKVKYRALIENEIVPFFENKITDETGKLTKAVLFSEILHEEFKVTIRLRNDVINKYREEIIL